MVMPASLNIKLLEAGHYVTLERAYFTTVRSLLLLQTTSMSFDT